MKKEDLSHILQSIKSAVTPIHKEGFAIIIGAFVTAFILSVFSSTLGTIATIFAFFCLYFFRDPERVVPKDENLVISPADGKVSAIVKNAEIPFGLELDKKQKWQRVSIFLSVFNVHVNRIPISGTVSKMHYNKGLFVNASLDKASEDNERQSCIIKHKNGMEIGLVQIAGLIARRIVCNLNLTQKVQTGERYGIIKFGSRVDLYLPNDLHIEVEVGQTAIGGETIITKINSKKSSETKKISKTKSSKTKTAAKKTVKTTVKKNVASDKKKIKNKAPNKNKKDNDAK